MATPGKNMKPIDDEISRIDAEIARLQGERSGLLKAKELLTGEGNEPARPLRRRAPSVKPVVLDVMRNAGPRGATTAEVDRHVRLAVPTVAKETVGSILSRLKSDGALVYEGDRYYDKRHAPGARAGDALRAVI